MPALRGSAFVSSGANTTSCTATIDAAVQSGDVLVLDVVNRDSTANVSVTDNDTGGNTWTLKTNQAANTNGSGQRWWKRATSGTAGKTITVSGATGSVACAGQAYSGCEASGDPLGATVGEANASANETQAGITTTRSLSWVLHMVACTSNDTLNPGNRTATSPTTITERGEGTSSGGSDCSVSHASAEKAAAGATGNISWSQTNGTGASMANELLAPISLGDDSDSFTGTAYRSALVASMVAAELAATTQNARAVAITGGDREEIPAGFVQPNLDDGYLWTPVIQPEWRSSSPLFDPNDWAPEPVPFIPDEDYRLPVIQWPHEPWKQPQYPQPEEYAVPIFDPADFIPSPRWPEEWTARQAPDQGDTWVSPPNLSDEYNQPQPRWPDEWLARQGVDLGVEMVPQPPVFLPPEDYWIAATLMPSSWNFVFYPPDRGEGAAEDPGIWTPDPAGATPTWTPDAVDSSQTWTPADS